MKTVLIYSGGLDSTVLLYSLLSQRREVLALGVNYGQRHRRELMAAARISSNASVNFRIVNLTALRPFLSGSSQTDDTIAVPHGHYEEETMKLTVVPNRNMIMLSVAIAYAISEKAACVTYAAHAGDHAIYPDCREEFAKALGKAAALADWHPVYLERPFVHMSKSDIVRLGESLSVPFADTWSCYEGGEKHCGKCGTCVERREAFEIAGIKDPTIYV